ncbi:hypothetical protein ULF88_12150 [Halopseudomonas pachastrellae]|nr:hypothetical protein [Halopseudomonas pachastrellae]
MDDGVVFHVGGDLAFKDVHAADELGGDVAADRAFIDVHRRADLGNPALMHDGDALGHGHGLFLIVGHHDAGYTDAFDNLDQFQLHLGTQLFIQGAHRLIEQQHLGPLGQ